jgi:hypothetical protein
MKWTEGTATPADEADVRGRMQIEGGWNTNPEAIKTVLMLRALRRGDRLMYVTTHTRAHKYFHVTLEEKYDPSGVYLTFGDTLKDGNWRLIGWRRACQHS